MHHGAFIAEQLRHTPHLTMAQLRDLLAARGVMVSHDTVWRFVRRQGRADIARRHKRWKGLQSQLDPSRLVFIDEAWIKTDMAPLRGCGPKGKRLFRFVPQGHWRTLTFLAAMRCDPMIAPCVFDGPINGECFRAYVDQNLVPHTLPWRHRHHGPSGQP